MKRVGIIGMAAAVMLICGVCQALEPAYQGPLGNNEEPALRPYKWMAQGLLSLVYHTGERIAHGNMKTPVLGTVEGFRGLRRGTLKMAESTWHGMLGAPLPPRGSKDYKRLGLINRRLEAEKVRRNAGDFAFSWWYFPVLKVVDTFPMETETQVAIRKANAEAIREAREAGTEPELLEVPQLCPFIGNLCCEEGDCPRTPQCTAGTAYGEGRTQAPRGIEPAE